MRADQFEDFLHDLDVSMGWHILLLQEFTSSPISDRFRSSAGHQVFLTAPLPGCRACCIVIRNSIAHKVLTSTVKFVSRGIALALHWEGWNLLVVSSHLDPNGIEDYRSSIHQLHDLCDTRGLRQKFATSNFSVPEVLSQPVYVVVGVDAQISVGPAGGRHLSCYIGEAVERDLVENKAKARCPEFIRFCDTLGLRAQTTFAADTRDVWTCHYDFRFLPAQLDYILTDLPGRSCTDTGVAQGDATDSDHRIVFVHVQGKWNQPPSVRPPTVPRPPIVWSCSDPDFNAIIRERLELHPACSCRPFPASHTSIYTDGSYAAARLRARTYSGWGFAIWDDILPIRECNVAYTAAGGITLSHTHTDYLGAERHSNNVGEMCAVIEAMIFILSIFEGGDTHRLRSLISRPIGVYTDSKYVWGIANNTLQPRENILLALLLRHLVFYFG